MSTSSQTEPGAGSNGSPDEVTAIRQIVKEYWDALNDYDVDRALPMLEPGYRAQEEEPIRQDISRMSDVPCQAGRLRGNRACPE